jgi:hypothetical protein
LRLKTALLDATVRDVVYLTAVATVALALATPPCRSTL